MQKLLSSGLLSKNIKIKIYGSVILPVTLYGCETWSLTWREKHRLDDVYSSPNIFQVIKSRRMRWVGNVVRTGEVRTGFWWRDLTERDQLEDLCIDGRIILKWVFKKWDGEGWAGVIYLRIGTGGGCL